MLGKRRSLRLIVEDKVINRLFLDSCYIDYVYWLFVLKRTGKTYYATKETTFLTEIIKNQIARQMLFSRAILYY